jgi:hypothetical protein
MGDVVNLRGPYFYTEECLQDAPDGHRPVVGTDVEVVAYRSGNDLVLLVNKGPKCCYRATLRGVMRPGFQSADTGPLCDSFVIRDLGEAKV